MATQPRGWERFFGELLAASAAAAPPVSHAQRAMACAATSAGGIAGSLMAASAAAMAASAAAMADPEAPPLSRQDVMKGIAANKKKARDERSALLEATAALIATEWTIAVDHQAEIVLSNMVLPLAPSEAITHSPKHLDAVKKANYYLGMAQEALQKVWGDYDDRVATIARHKYVAPLPAKATRAVHSPTPSTHRATITTTEFEIDDAEREVDRLVALPALTDQFSTLPTEVLAVVLKIAAVHTSPIVLKRVCRQFHAVLSETPGILHWRYSAPSDIRYLEDDARMYVLSPPPTFACAPTTHRILRRNTKPNQRISDTLCVCDGVLVRAPPFVDALYIGHRRILRHLAGPVGLAAHGNDIYITQMQGHVRPTRVISAITGEDIMVPSESLIYRGPDDPVLMKIAFAPDGTRFEVSEQKPFSRIDVIAPDATTTRFYPPMVITDMVVSESTVYCVNAEMLWSAPLPIVVGKVTGNVAGAHLQTIHHPAPAKASVAIVGDVLFVNMTSTVVCMDTMFIYAIRSRAPPTLLRTTMLPAHNITMCGTPSGLIMHGSIAMSLTRILPGGVMAPVILCVPPPARFRGRSMALMYW